MSALVSACSAQPLAQVPLEIGHSSAPSQPADEKAYAVFRIGTIATRLFLDIGNPTATIDLSPAILRRTDARFTGESRPLRNFQGRSFERRLYVLPEARLGLSDYALAKNDGLLGYAFFTNHAVLLDTSDHIVYVRPPAGPGALVPSD